MAAEKRASFRDDDYWGLPVPNFGNPDATLLIVGLAPAAHGANRTGRMFTGDRSGDWLYRSLHAIGAANQPHATDRGDGLALRGALITAVNHCAPPGNKPTPEEMDACSVHLQRTLALRPWRAVLCLGGIAWDRFHKTLGEKPQMKFGHGVESTSVTGLRVFGCYHPSQQNTFTGRLTRPMLEQVLARWWACR